jgi:hypothetical protein
MTRKDYELIARVLREKRPETRGLGLLDQQMWHGIVTAMADALPATNPDFDRSRFLRACGVL